MTILGFLFFAFLFYLAFRLIFDFILPIYRTTQKVRKGFQEMNARMNRGTEPYKQQQTQTQQNQDNTSKGGIGEYIDFEEIKD
jgi:hypothetical protein